MPFTCLIIGLHNSPIAFPFLSFSRTRPNRPQITLNSSWNPYNSTRIPSIFIREYPIIDGDLFSVLTDRDLFHPPFIRPLWTLSLRRERGGGDLDFVLLCSSLLLLSAHSQSICLFSIHKGEIAPEHERNSRNSFIYSFSIIQFPTLTHRHSEYEVLLIILMSESIFVSVMLQ